ncbi:MAG TPA: hypothetical protein ACFE0H_15570 [Elainellaceae cyanobacterium]
MGKNIGFILKILGISTIAAIAIKYAAPYLNIPATPATAISIVLLPSMIMAVLLSWRVQNHEQ